MSTAAADVATPPRGIVRDLITLTKPRIISLLLVTTVCAMFAAQQGVPNGWLILWTVIGGYLSAGGANTINCFIERDRDQVMQRTHARPLPKGAYLELHVTVDKDWQQRPDRLERLGY